MGCLKLICALHLVHLVLVIVSKGHGWTIRVNYRTEKVGSVKVPTIDTVYEHRTARIHPFQIFYPFFPEKIDNGVGVGGGSSSSSSSSAESMALNNETEKFENFDKKFGDNISILPPPLPPPIASPDSGEKSTSSSSEEEEDSDESSSSSSSSSSEEEEDAESGSGEDQNKKEDSSEEEEDDDDDEGAGEEEEDDDDENENNDDSKNHDTERPDITLPAFPALPGLPGLSDWKSDFGENFFADLLTGLDFMEIASHVFEIVVDMGDDDDNETSSTTQRQNLYTDETIVQTYPSSSTPLSLILRLPTAAANGTTTTTAPSAVQVPFSTTTEKPLNGPSVVMDKKLTNETQDVSVLEIFYPHSGIEIKSFAAGTTLTLAFCALLLLLWKLTKNRSGKVLQNQYNLQQQQQQQSEAPPMYNLKV